MNHKFRFRIFSHQMLDLDNARFKQVCSGLKDGDYELILRPKPNWDTDQMRKYFHGPVLKHFMDGYRNLGINMNKPAMKDELKGKYGARVITGIGHGKTIVTVKSTADYTTEDYKELLKGANLLSIDHLECELPPAEQVES